ncbi:MAG: C25 family cysteine peptidase [bacterium]|nr:C25 family cysteine peptidase [bacterium]
MPRAILQLAWSIAVLSIAAVVSLLLPNRVQCQAADAIVIRPASWAAALDDWKRFRSAQGLELIELDAELGQQRLRERIAALYQQHPRSLRFVLLAADVNPQGKAGIPTFYRESSALVQFGGDSRIATDNPYADIDGDERPELAVARIPADNADSLRRHLARVIAYESAPDFSEWRRQVHVIAGVGGFGLLADSVIEMTTRRFLSDRIPGWSDLSMTQASDKSLYCPDPWRFSEACLERMNEGGMFWVYIGHGHVKTLDYVRAGEEYLPILTDQHLPAVASKHPPIAVFLACYTGAFDAVEDSLAEQLVMLDRGPIAAIAATRVSGPYGLSMLSDGLLDDFYEKQMPTLGEVVLSAKQRLLDEQPQGIDGSPQASQKQMINAIAKALSPEGYDLRAERLEHVWQMHLLGDPMMRIHHPVPMDLQMPRVASPGERIAIRGQALAPGRLTMELAYRRDQPRRELYQITADSQTPQGRANLQKRYMAANDRVLATASSQCEPGDFLCNLSVPDGLPKGKYCVRLFLEGETQWQVGYRELSIRPTEIAE